MPEHPMRIALLVTQLESGGAQRVAIDIADGLREQGHTVETWFFYQKSAAFDSARDVHLLLPSKPRGWFSLPSLACALHAAFHRFQPEATITFTHYANVLGSLAATLAGVSRRVASQHNPPWTYPALVRWGDRLAGNVGLYTANVAVSQAVHESFKGYSRWYRRRLIVVPNGSRLRTTREGKHEARRRFQIPVSEFMILAVGRLHPQKNHAILLRALATLPNLHLTLAGDGELRLELERLDADLGILSRVRFLGSIPSELMPALFKAADVFAMPSRFEGQSIALIEALAAGLPIVSSRIPSQVEVLTDSEGRECAILLECDDVDAWAASLRELHRDERIRVGLAQAAAGRAAAFDIEATVQGYRAALLHEL